LASTVLLAGCATLGDAERTLGASYITAKYIRDGDKAQRIVYVHEVADLVEGATGPGATGNLVHDGLTGYINRQDLLPEDVILAEYLRDKVVEKIGDRLELPLEDEWIRIAGVYVAALRDTADKLEAEP
jgi:hypothetical protein